MALDLAGDTARMGATAAQSAQGVDAIDSILNARPSDPSTPGRIGGWIPWVVQSSVFNPEGEEYEALRSSGRLGLISDPALLAGVTSYYSELDYIAEMYRFDIDQSHAVGELLYPHVEFPRSGYALDSGPPFFPSPRVAGSVTDLLDDRVFVNEMTYLGFLKQLIARSAIDAAEEAAELLRLIEQELNS